MVLENPAITTPHWAFAVVDLWVACRGAGLMPGTAMRALPGAGGVGDQPAGLIDAFNFIEQLSKEGETP